MARTALKLVGLLLVAALCWALFVVLSRHQIDLPLKDGGRVRIVPASFLGTFRESRCLVTYTPKGGRGGTIALLETRIEWPVMVIPSTETNVLLCLYNFDMDLRLLRIDTEKKFTPFLPDSPLRFVVRESPWK